HLPDQSSGRPRDAPAGEPPYDGPGVLRGLPCGRAAAGAGAAFLQLRAELGLAAERPRTPLEALSAGLPHLRRAVRRAGLDGARAAVALARDRPLQVAARGLHRRLSRARSVTPPWLGRRWRLG